MDRRFRSPSIPLDIFMINRRRTTSILKAKLRGVRLGLIRFKYCLYNFTIFLNNIVYKTKGLFCIPKL